MFKVNKPKATKSDSEASKLKARNWLCTYNNPKDVQFVIEYLEKWITVGKAKYVTG